jgi:predicted RNase H-like HicB family nuclease
MTHRYTVVLTEESDGQISVRVPAMTGIITWGANEAEALELAREAIALHLEGYRERGQPYPEDREVRLSLGRHRDRATLARIAVDDLVTA